MEREELKEELERVDDRNNDLVKICQEYEDKINKAIEFNKKVLDIYTEDSMEYSNAVTNLITLGDEETIERFSEWTEKK